MEFEALKKELENFEKEFIYTDIKDVWVKEAKKKHPYPVQSFSYGTLDFSSLDTLFSIAKKETGDPDKVLILGSGIGRAAFYLSFQFSNSKIKAVEILEPYVSFCKKMQKKYDFGNINFSLQDAKDCNLSAYNWVILFADLWTQDVLRNVFQRLEKENNKAFIISTRIPHKDYLTQYLRKETLELASSWNDKLLVYLIEKNNNSYADALNTWKIDSKNYRHKLLSVFKEQILKADNLEEKEKALEIFEKITDFASDNFLEIFEVEATRIALEYEEDIKNMDKSIYWYKKAANAGSELSQLKLGLLYQEGKFVSENRKEAIKWLKMAADCGSKVAIDYFLHITSLEALKIYGDGKSLGNALEALRLLDEGVILEQNEIKALFELIISTVAMFFLEGKVSKKETEEAFYFIKLADRVGSPLAKKYLGDIAFQIANFFLNVFEHSQERDFKKAEKYYKEAFLREVPSANWLFALTLFEQEKNEELDFLFEELEKEEKEEIYGKLFYIYFLGDAGFEEDLDKANVWLKKLQKIGAGGSKDLQEVFLVKKKMQKKDTKS
jgi:TPR repeat protein